MLSVTATGTAGGHGAGMTGGPKTPEESAKVAVWKKIKETQTANNSK
jgi:hypothetical protein